MLDGVSCDVRVTVAVGRAALIALLLDPGCGASLSSLTPDNKAVGAVTLFGVWHSRFGSLVGGVLGFVPRLVFATDCLGLFGIFDSPVRGSGLIPADIHWRRSCGVVDLGGCAASGRGDDSRG